MTISQIGKDINKRFFFALDRLIQDRQIRGVQTFTKEFGINRWNLLTVKKEPESRFVKTEWLSYLVLHYGISAEWLLTGIGSVYSTKK